MLLIKRMPVRLFFTVLCMSLYSTFAKAQTDKIEGVWYNDVKSGKVQIYKASDGKFNGKVIWLKEPLKNGRPKLDEMNADPALRTKPRLGLQVLSGFEKDGDNKYSNGKIYDPLNGKTYSCKMTLKGDKLEIRGFIGISLFGRTTVWSRAE
jgi:uncharacterized protein (DUF2147 family)